MAPRATTASAAAPMRSDAGGPPLAMGAAVSCTATALGDGDTVGVSVAADTGEALALGDGVGASDGVAASVGTAVGGAVGGAVRTGVGGAVGCGVGCGVLGPWTITVPFMNRWMAQ